MDKQKLLFMIARHEQFLRRVARMLAAGQRGDELPNDAEFQTEEIQGLDSSAADLAVELSGSVPNEREWMPPGRYAFENGYMKPGALTWLRSFEQGLRMSKRYFELFLPTSAMEVHMGDKITVGAAQVVMGSHARTGEISTQGSVRQGGADQLALAQLADELSTLRKAMRRESDPDDASQDIDLGAVAQAEKAARSGDHEGVMAQLKSVGKWCLDVATKIGVNLATEAIKSSTGLGK